MLYIAPQEILDHTAQVFEWFSEVDGDREDGNLKLSSNPHVTGEPKVEKVVTPEDLYRVVRSMAEKHDRTLYGQRFLEALLAGSFDETDGDDLIVDDILQVALFGDIIYG